MQVYLGSLYVNDFNRFGRTYQVNAQADMPFRLEPEDILRAQGAQRAGRDGAARLVRHARADARARASCMRYNGYPTAEINGGPAPGFSSGQARGG